MSGYKNFSEYDLIQDISFMEWMLAPTKESDNYWNSVMTDDPQFSIVVEKAQTLFRESVKLSNHRESDEVIERLLNQLSARIKAKRRRVRLMRRISIGLAAAACAVAAIIYIPQNHQPKNDYVLAVRQAGQIDETPTGEVTLLSESAAITIVNNSDIIIDDLLSSISKDTGLTKKSNIKLIVPNGRQSSVRLNDGSVVWVNAGSRVSFPERFDDGEREISIDGEVYLSVVKDPLRPFIVNVGDVKVRVLGTEFGITAYSADDQKSIVLVSGSVEVSVPGGDNVRLRPNQRIAMADDNFDVVTVDVMEYVSWKNGWLQINSINLSELMTKLSRYYDREIVCEEGIRNLTCSGKLLLSDDIETTLKVVARNMGISYTISEDKIILHP